MKHNILILTPGPAMAINEEHYNDLSKYLYGTIITSSRIPAIINRKMVGSFEWNCFLLDKKKHVSSRIKFIIYILRECISMRLRGKHYDLVVTYDPLITGLIGVLASKILGAKFAPEINGVYTNKNVFADGNNKLKNTLSSILYPALEAFVLKRAHGIKILFPRQIAPFKKLRKSVVIGNFPCKVNTKLFLNYPDYEERPEILFVGFPFHLKGVDILIKAFKQISEHHNKWSLKILGWYPDKTDLENAIGGHDRITLIPPVFPDEMPQHICTCGIFVLPSRSEAMGRVLVEAMAAGKARIGANIDGIPTVITNGVDGLLFESEDVNDLAEKLQRLIKDKALRRRLGNSGRQRAIKEFNNETYYSNLVQFYSDILINN